MTKIGDIRRDYNSLEFELNNDIKSPFGLFGKWFQEAVLKEKYEPNAMALSTVSEEGRPSSRFVLLKHYDDSGFVFYTNYSSSKSKQLEVNPNAALAFYWPILERQIRVEGSVVKLSAVDSDKYFDSRPDGSKIGAWASPQSQPIQSRTYLEEIKKEFEEKFTGTKIPRPNYWGGFKLIPNKIEFWQGREDRLHDRFEFQLTNHSWNITRLAP